MIHKTKNVLLNVTKETVQISRRRSQYLVLIWFVENNFCEFHDDSVLEESMLIIRGREKAVIRGMPYNY